MGALSSGLMLEQMAGFADAASADHLSRELRDLFKRNILDSLGCALGALNGAPFVELRSQFAQYRAAGPCTLIGGGVTSTDQAAFYNSALVRYVDLLDSYMSPGGLCHPADNFGGVLAVAQACNASGEDFMLALAVAYEMGMRLTAALPVMSKGFNHALQLALSLAAASGKLLHLSWRQLTHAMAIATVDNVSLAAVHSEPVSQWKGFSPGITAMRTVYTTELAKRGFTGPLQLFEGPNGLERMFGQPIRIDWTDLSLNMIRHTVMKKYCALIHGQPVLEAVLDLRRRHGILATEVTAVTCETFQGGFDIAGGGSFGPKDHPTTKEQADYNLKYLIAVALIDGQVGPSQLDESRVNAPDTQALLPRIEIAPNSRYSQGYPDHLGCRIEIRSCDGEIYQKEQSGYEGGLNQPLTWERVVEKFHWLAEPYADAHLRESIVLEVRNLENRPVAGLMQLLARSRLDANSCRTSRGIQ